MGMIQLSDEVNAAIDRAVASGLSTSATSLVEQAVRHLLEDARWDQTEIVRLATAGTADMDAGRYVNVTNEQEHRTLMDEIVARCATA